MATPVIPAEVVSNADVIPVIESSVFDGHEESRYAVGVIAVGDQALPGFEDEYQAYKLLRGNVYAHQEDYMPVEDLQADGTETDSDDIRSVHFAVIENLMGNRRVVGAMRLIVKSNEHPEKLPIEDHYPEAFGDGPATLGSTEASRLISRHESNREQRGIKWLLFAAGVSYINEHDLGPAYGAVPQALARALRIEGMPVTDLGDPKYIPEFNAIKMPIRIDLAGLTEKIADDQPGVLEEVAHTFVYADAFQRPRPEAVPPAGAPATAAEAATVA